MGSRTFSSEVKISRLVVLIAFVLVVIQIRSSFRRHSAAYLDISSQQPHCPINRGTTPVSTFPDPFPRKIWQTQKHGFINIDDHETKEAIISWLKLNQNWRYEILSDYSAENYVRNTFVDRPEIIELYFDIGDPILRADMLRYLIMLGDGGVYSDTDTRALKPIDDWIPVQYRSAVNVVVGIEYDSMGGDRWVDWTLDLQFTNWAMMAKPRHPVMDLTIRMLSYRVHELAIKKETDIGHLQLSQHQILNCTGPALLTSAVFEHLNSKLKDTFDWTNITQLKEPRLVDDILVLPVNSFGNSQPHSNSGSSNSDDAFVQHLFKGSWKGDRPMRDEKDMTEEEKKEEERREKWEKMQAEQDKESGKTERHERWKQIKAEQDVVFAKGGEEAEKARQEEKKDDSEGKEETSELEKQKEEGMNQRKQREQEQREEGENIRKERERQELEKQQWWEENGEE